MGITLAALPAFKECHFLVIKDKIGQDISCFEVIEYCTQRNLDYYIITVSPCLPFPFAGPAVSGLEMLSMAERILT